MRNLANKTETFPSNMVAGMFGFKKREFFEIEESSQRDVPAIDLD